MKYSILFLASFLFGCDITLETSVVVPDVIGYHGCSMTRDLGQGMHLAGVYDSWEKRDSAGNKVLQLYSGGTLSGWGTPGGNGYSLKWGAFEQGLESWPDTDLILWQVCIKAEEVTPDPLDSYDKLKHIADSIASKAAGIPVYVTAMPDYVGVSCSITGPNGVSFAQSLVQTAIDSSLALDAVDLVLGPLSSSHLKGDNCHVNAAGRELEVDQFTVWLDSL